MSGARRRRIVEQKETLAGERRRFSCRLLALAPGEAVILYVLPSAGQIADLALPRGTRSLGYFWEARPYNAYHWLAPGGETLALYVNVADRTRISATRVAWRDLTVDLLITPDGRCRVLDEDELAADLDPTLRAAIDAARDEVLAGHPALLAEVERRSAELLTSGF